MAGTIISRIFSSKQKITLLEWLGVHDGNFSISDLSRATGLPKATVSKIVLEWESAGLALSELHGKNKLVSINKKFYLYPEIRKMLSKNRKPHSELIQRPRRRMY